MRKILSCMICLTAAANLAAEDTAVYRMLRDKTETVLTVRSAPPADGDGMTVRTTAPGEERTVAAAADFAARSFAFRQTAAGTEYTAVRRGDTIFVTGTLKRRPLERQWRIGNGAWCQAIEQTLERLARSGARYLKFHFINADDCELIEMEATREGIETVTIAGKTERAVRIKVNLPGLAALFWRADYWFRESDGTYLRYETVEGPGGPRLTIELLSRETGSEQEE